MNVVAPSSPEHSSARPAFNEPGEDYDTYDNPDALESSARGGRHRRTAGRIAYQIARETGDPHLIETANQIARREYGGHHDAGRDAREFIRLVMQPPERTAHHQNANGYQDPNMTTIFRPDVTEVQRHHDAFDAPALTARDFDNGHGTTPHSDSHANQLPTGISIPQQRTRQK